MAHGSLIVWHDSTWKNNLYGVNKYLHHISKKLLNIKLLRISPFDFCSLVCACWNETVVSHRPLTTCSGSGMTSRGRETNFENSLCFRDLT